MKISTEPLFALLTLVLVGLVAFLRDIDMSYTAQTMLLGVFVAAVFGYAVFIYRENPVDEREQSISLQASKYAYLLGAAVLSLGVVIQSLDHELDIWLPLALGSMVFAKSLGYFIHNR